MKTEHDADSMEKGARNSVFERLRLAHGLSDASPLPLLGTEGWTHLVLFANPAFCRLAGHTSQELIGRPLTDTLPEGERERCLALLDRVYLTGKTETLGDQTGSPYDSQRPYWSFAAWAVLDENERPCAVMLQVSDTTAAVVMRQRSLAISEALTVSAVRLHEQTERAEAGERRLHQVLRESDHRMKNHLQMICALLDIQTVANDESVPVSELVQIRNHIRTLAAIHDMLTKDVEHELTANVLSVREVLRELLPMLQQVVGIEPIQWEADDSRLPVKQGTSMAVIVNELVTNAVKHGGRKIDLTVLSSDRTMNLTVCDDGPGFPAGFDPRADANFGLDLLESVVRLELDGNISFRNRLDGGACVTIVFPLPVPAGYVPAGSQ